jgi:hypothetical protein
MIDMIILEQVHPATFTPAGIFFYKASALF